MTGSTDNSLQIITEYAQKDDRITIISRENMGLLYSRVEGCKNADGEYIIFVDSDDWIENDYIETLLNKITEEKVDVVRSGSFNRVDEEDKYINSNMRFTKQEKVLKNEFENKVFKEMCVSNNFNNVWGQIISTKSIKKCIQSIDISISMGEDLEFNMNLYQHINSIVLFEYLGYNYRINMMSISKSLRRNQLEKNLNDEIKVYKNLTEVIKKNYNNIIKYAYARYLLQINSHLSRLIYASDISKKDFEMWVDKIFNLKEINEIRKSISFKDINLIKDKKSILAKLIYKNKHNLYCFIVEKIYIRIKK